MMWSNATGFHNLKHKAGVGLLDASAVCEAKKSTRFRGADLLA
jgi:hypothetical protein